MESESVPGIGNRPRLTSTTWIHRTGEGLSHISVGVEYGLHCLLYLAGPPHGVDSASVRDLAELQGLPIDYAAKLFTKLRRAGLVASTEGRNGGFRLARPAGEISVLDVVRAIDGRKPLFDCRDVRKQCVLFEGRAPRWAADGVCSIHAVMLAAERQMNDALATQSLGMLAQRVEAKAPSDFGRRVVRWMANRRTTPGE